MFCFFCRTFDPGGASFPERNLKSIAAAAALNFNEPILD